MAKDSNKNKSVRLPNAYRTIKRSNDMKQSKADFKSISSFIVGLIIAGLIAFVLLGGISQRGLVEWAYHWSETVSQKVADWISGGGIEINDDGVYVRPNGNGIGIINDSSTNTNNNETSEKNNEENNNTNSTNEESNNQTSSKDTSEQKNSNN